MLNPTCHPPRPQAPSAGSMEDVQGRADTREIEINKVGIKDIRHPVRVRDRTGHDQHTVATFAMYVTLPQHFKGTHMSRFVSILEGQDREITVASFHEMLAEMTERLEARSGHIEKAFPYFGSKRAPVSGVESLMDYAVKLIGEIHGERHETWVQVEVPVTTLCPCSKEIAERGAHNQRSSVIVTALTEGFVWLEELIDLVEEEGSCDLYGLLKRPDEKYVTERAYDNPKFVEDVVRDIAGRLNRDDRIAAYQVTSENYESIHNHSAFALIENDKRA